MQKLVAKLPINEDLIDIESEFFKAANGPLIGIEHIEGGKYIPSIGIRKSYSNPKPTLILSSVNTCRGVWTDYKNADALLKDVFENKRLKIVVFENAEEMAKWILAK